MSTAFNASLRTPIFSPLGITVPLQLPRVDSLACLWTRHQSTALYDDIARIFGDESTGQLLGLADIKVNASFKLQEFEAYRDVFLPFQGKTCGRA